jgi:hypothetical protein
MQASEASIHPTLPEQTASNHLVDAGDPTDRNGNEPTAPSPPEPIALLATNSAPPTAVPIMTLFDKDRPAPVATLLSVDHEPRLEPSAVTGNAPNQLPALEERVRRLEAELALLQDTRSLETRVAAQVQDKLAHDLGSVTGTPPTAGLVEISKRLLGLGTPPPRTLSPRPEGTRNGWLLFELWAEARAIVRMFVDPRYRMSWVGRFLPLGLMVAFVFSDYVISILLPVLGSVLLNIPVFGRLFDHAVQLVIGFVLFKVLGLEARRYRQTSPDLPASLKL